MGWRDRAEAAALTWHPERGGRRAWVCFEDEREYTLGHVGTGERFDRIADRMLGGDYYPPDAVVFDGRFREENRPLRPGDRVLQSAPLFLAWGGPRLRSAVEVFVASRGEDECEIGYVTTAMHHGRGIWRARLRRIGSELRLHVASVARPNSWLFWLGLPVARWVQLRARRRAVEAFRSMP